MNFFQGNGDIVGGTRLLIRKLRSRVLLVFGLLLFAATLVLPSSKAEAANVAVDDDFSTNTNLWNYIGAAQRTSGGLMMLTPSAQRKVGTVWLKQTMAPPYVVTFKYMMTGAGPFPYTLLTDGADGIVFMFNKLQNTSPVGGGGMGFETGNGYGVEFDSYSNEWDPASNHISLFKNNPDHRVAGSLIGQVNDNTIENNGWHDVKVIVNPGSVQVFMDGYSKVTWTGTLDQTFSGIGFTASTGYYYNTQYIDNVVISKPATVESVSSGKASGTYRVGDVIPVNVKFNDTVTVNPSSPPQLAMKTGKTAVYAGGNGTNTLTFNYTVQQGEYVTDLDYGSASALTGGVTDSNGLAAVRTLPAPGAAGSLSAAFDLNLDAGSMTINNGALRTNTAAVNLQLIPAFSGTVQMSFLNSGSTVWSAWETFTAAKAWTLASGDGTRTVSVRFRNSSGTISQIFTDTIEQDLSPPAPPSFTPGTTANTNGNVVLTISYPPDAAAAKMYKIGSGGTYTNYTGPVTITGNTVVYARGQDLFGNWSTEAPFTISNIDKTAPTGTININNGTTVSNSTAVTLQLTANDSGAGGIQMQFSDNGGSVWSTWEPFSATKGRTLPAGDGSKTVMARFKDAVGNVSPVYSKSILLDTTPPAAPAFSASPTGATNGNVSVTVSYPLDAAVKEYKLSANESYLNYSAPLSIDSNKTVYARSKDAAGNTAESSYTVGNIDKTAPTGSITVNNGAAVTNDLNAVLQLSSSDTGSGGISMELSNNGSSWNAPAAFNTTAGWELPSGDGIKTVYVRFKDAVGNLSTIYSDTITVDTTPPASAAFSASPTGYTANNVSLTIVYPDDAAVKQFKLGAGGTYTDYTAPIMLTANQTVFARSKDAAGNGSVEVQHEVSNIDKSAPSGAIAVASAAGVTNVTDIELLLSATDTGAGGITMQLSNDGIWGTDWEAFQTNRGWRVSDGDGTKTVYVRYKDSLGHISQTYSGTIVLDTVAPAAPELSASPAGYTGDTVSVSVTYALDTADGKKEYKLESDAGYQAYTSPILLNVNDKVYARAQDAAGNLSPESFIIVSNIDRTAPAGSISINSGAEVTGGVYGVSGNVYGLSVTGSVYTSLKVSASDSGAGGIQMRFSNDESDWSTWEPYKPARDWTLDSGSGIKTVYAQFRDSLNNQSSTVTGSVYYDPSILGATFTSSLTEYTNEDVTVTIDFPLTAVNREYSYDGITVAEAAYSSSVTLTRNTTVVAVSSDETNATVTTSYTVNNIDKEAPSAALSIAGITEGAVTNQSAVTLLFNSADTGGSNGLQMQVKLNAAGWSDWENYSTSKSWSLLSGDGLQTAQARFKDAAGNVSGAVYTSLVLDTEGPEGLEITSSPEGWTNGSVTANVYYPADAAVKQIKLGSSGSFAAYAGPLSLTDNETVFARAQDAAGNWSAEAQLTINKIDQIAPAGTVIIVDENADGLSNELPVNLQLTATDSGGSGIAAMRFANDPFGWTDNWEAYAGNKSWVLSAGDGLKTVYVQVKDGAGNISTDSILSSLMLDTTGPDTPDITAEQSAYTKDHIQVAISYPPDAVEKQYRIDGGSYLNYAGPFSVSSNGTIYAKGKDTAGNGSAEASYQITKIDKTPPAEGSIQINGGASLTRERQVSLQLSSSDAESGVTEMRFSLNGLAWDEWEAYQVTKDWVLSAGDGEKTLYVQYRDAVGNESSSTMDSIILDTAAPGLANFSVSTLEATKNDVLIDILYPADSVPDSRQYRLGSGGGYKAYSSAAIPLTVNDVVYARSSDEAGNESAESFIGIDYIDKQAPVGSITIEGGAEQAASYDVVLQLNALDFGVGGVEMQLSNDGAGWSAWEAYASFKPWRLLNGIGTKTVYVRYRDGLGNQSEASDSIIIQGDSADAAEAKDALIADSVFLNGNPSLDEVRTKLNLPVASIHETTISWESSSASVSADGSVVRPPFNAADEYVILTATISKNSISTTKVFPLTVQKLDVSDEASLSQLSVDVGFFTPAFTPDVFDYTVKLSKHTNDLELTPELNNNAASLTINDTATKAVYSNGIIKVSELNMGMNEVSLTVTAAAYAGGSHNDYRIRLFKASDEKEIVSFSLSGEVIPAVIDAETGTVTATVPYAYDRTALTAQISLSAGAAVNMDPALAKDYTRPFAVIVTAQDGTQRTWTLATIEAPAVIGTPVPVLSDKPLTFANGVALNFNGVEVEAGATMTMETVEPDVADFKLVAAGAVADFDLQGMTLNGTQGVELALPLGPGVDPNQVGVGLFYYDGATWQEQLSEVRGNTVVATVYHFSTYGVFTSGNADLSALTVTNGGVLAEPYRQGQQDYMIFADSMTNKFAVKAVKAESHAKLTVTGATYTLLPDGSIEVQLDGVNKIDMEVTARDGSTVKTYTLYINRQLAYAYSNETGNEIRLMFREKLSAQPLSTSNFALSGTNASVQTAIITPFAIEGTMITLYLSESIKEADQGHVHLAVNGLVPASGGSLNIGAIPIIPPQYIAHIKEQIDGQDDGIGIEDIVNWQKAKTDVTLDQQVDKFDLLFLMQLLRQVILP
ncbi:MAG: tandem-95 repeat protein [Paenibacillus sp.]|jgi:hypothetical protein|nr:tandem-95 repeat protein [Paenibacillus sp.]